jgi:hypothetical protein
MNFSYNSLNGKDESVSDLMAAIGRCQSDFPALPKNATGQAGPRKYKYASLDQIIESMKPQLKQHGVSFMHLVSSDGKQANLTLLVCGHGAAVETSFAFYLDKNPQDFGKALTYYKRYQLSAFFGIVADDDADSDSVEANKQKYADKQAQEDKPVAPSVIQVVEEGSDEREEEHEQAVRAEADGKGYLFDRKGGNTKSANLKLTDIKKALKWSFDQFHEYCVAENLYPAGCSTMSKLPYESKCDLIDSIMNNPKFVGKL